MTTSIKELPIKIDQERDKCCPFCGSNSIDKTCSAADKHRKFYFVFCNVCEACGPTDYVQATAIERWSERRQPECG